MTSKGKAVPTPAPVKEVVMEVKDPRQVFMKDLVIAVDRGFGGNTSIKVTGELSVQNIGPEKSIHILYTLNAWSTTVYVTANWNCNIENSDREKWTFSFLLPTEDEAYEQPKEANLEFTVQYISAGHPEYIDDNDGNGYYFNVKRPIPVYEKWQSVRVSNYTWLVYKHKALGVLAIPKAKSDAVIAVRFSTDFWKSTKETEIDSAYYGTETKYLTFKETLGESNKFEFVAKSKLVGAADFWDNNLGRNFGFFPGHVLYPKPAVTVVEEVKVESKSEVAKNIVNVA